MIKEKEEILEELRTKKEVLQEKAPENIVIQNIKLLGTVKLIKKEVEKEESKTAKLYLVEEYNKDTDEIMLKYYADDEFIGIDNNGEFLQTGLALDKYEDIDSIKDVLENIKEDEEIQKDATEKEKKQKVYDLNELEQEKEQEEKGESKDEDKEEIEEKKLTSDTIGATSLDQEVDRRTLRNLIGLEGDDAYIKPISASQVKEKYGININTKEGIEIIKQDGTSRLAGEDIFKQDEQEGNNSFNKDLNIEVDGDVEYKSNTTSLELVNMPNHYISMGYDDMTSKREIKFSKRSGREGHREPEKELLKEGASEYRDPDQRNMTRRNEEGIGEGDEIRARQETYEKAGIKNDRVENIDNYTTNDNVENSVINKDDKVPGKDDLTFEEWAEELGEGANKIIERFQREIQQNPEREPEKIVNIIEDDYQNLGPNRDRR